jgi:hypothetical protein
MALAPAASDRKTMASSGGVGASGGDDAERDTAIQGLALEARQR